MFGSFIFIVLLIIGKGELMIWFVLILAIVFGLAVGIIKRDISKGARAGLIVLVSGIVLSFLIVYSGILGG